MKQDLENMRKTCLDCNENQPSQPKEPPKGMIMPSYPFETLHCDYFHIAGKVFLLMVDAYTSWPVIRNCEKGGTAAELKEALVEIFSTYGIPKTMVSDGGPQFTAHETQELLQSWGVEQRITSAYNPHANLRAETGVKSMKRILHDAVGTGYKLNGEKASMALMEYRNTPLRDLERTPAQLLYGRHLRDLIQIRDEMDGGRYNIQEDFQLTAEDRERAFWEKMKREGTENERKGKERAGKARKCKERN